MSQVMQPFVSICIPYYNSEEYIEETLVSIFKQSYSNFEIIIGDNASSNSARLIIEKIIEKYNFSKVVRYIEHDINVGYAGNCNSMIKSAKGEFIAIYHSDDIYHCDIIEKQVRVLLDFPDVTGCFTDFKRISSSKEINESLIERKEKLDFFDYDRYCNSILNAAHNPFFCPSSMIRKTAYLKSDLYDTNLRYVEDQDMWFRLLELESSLFTVLRETLVYYRVHEKQGSQIYFSSGGIENNPIINHLNYYLRKRFGKDDFLVRFKGRIDNLKSVYIVRSSYFYLKKSASVNYSDYKCSIKSSLSISKIPMTNVLYKYSLIQNLPVWMSFFLIRSTAKLLGK